MNEFRSRKVGEIAGTRVVMAASTASRPRQRGRVATRRRARERRKPRPTAPRKAAPDAPPSELQTKIAEAEGERLALERRAADAFTRGDHREGSRVARQLERHASQLDDLYRRWVEEEG